MKQNLDRVVVRLDRVGVRLRKVSSGAECLVKVERNLKNPESKVRVVGRLNVRRETGTQ